MARKRGSVKRTPRRPESSSKSGRQRGPAEASGPKRGSRQRRKELAHRARRSKQLRRAVIIAAVVAVLAGLGWPIFQSFRSDTEVRAALTAGTYTHDQKHDPGRDHVADPSYEVNPPAGGTHLAAPAAPGDYTGEPSPADGALVHSMEHGLVILWFRPDLGADGKAALQAIAAEYPNDVLLVERRSMPTRVAATAWHQRLLGDTVERKALIHFITEFRGKGPENVE